MTTKMPTQAEIDQELNKPFKSQAEIETLLAAVFGYQIKEILIVLDNNNIQLADYVGLSQPDLMHALQGSKDSLTPELTPLAAENQKKMAQIRRDNKDELSEDEIQSKIVFEQMEILLAYQKKRKVKHDPKLLDRYNRLKNGELLSEINASPTIQPNDTAAVANMLPDDTSQSLPTADNKAASHSSDKPGRSHQGYNHTMFIWNVDDNHTRCVENITQEELTNFINTGEHSAFEQAEDTPLQKQCIEKSQAGYAAIEKARGS